jgi:pimeloyl-ACP methyl ester carboxylesterase
VLLPSQARDSDDYDAVADRLERAGYLVLRPQPRGIGLSEGPLCGITLGDLARDIAEVIEAEGAGNAVILGHAFGHYVARMVAQAFPDQVKGIIVAASAAKTYPAHLSKAVTEAGDPSLPEEVRVAALRLAFFAPGNDPRCWLEGWYPHMQAVQRAARMAVKQETYWAGGDVPLLDLQAEFDPFKPPDRRNEMRDEFGDRVSIALVANASHALIPEQPAAVAEAAVAWMRSINHA